MPRSTSRGIAAGGGGGYCRAVRRSPGFLALVACFTLAAVPAEGADPPLPAGIPDLLGARALSMGAYRGVAAGNDGIFTNAASLAALRRYAVESQWTLDRVGDGTALQAYGGSVVDSETGSVTGGFGYTRVLGGPWLGSLYHMALAVPLGRTFFLGGTGKYQNVDGPGGQHMSAANVDASAFLKPGWLALGVSGYNLLSTGHKSVQPRGLGVGASVGDDRRFHLAVDWRGDYDRAEKLTSAYAVGGELLLGDFFPVRAGYLKDDTRRASFWSGGLGIITTSGFAVDLAYRQRIEAPTERMFGLAIKIFLMSQ